MGLHFYIDLPKKLSVNKHSVYDIVEYIGDLSHLHVVSVNCIRFWNSFPFINNFNVLSFGDSTVSSTNVNVSLLLLLVE